MRFRKESKQSRLRLLRLPAVRLFCYLVCCVLPAASGCSVFPKSLLPPDYSTLEEEIEGGASYRPEGAKAESGYGLISELIKSPISSSEDNAEQAKALYAEAEAAFDLAKSTTDDSRGDKFREAAALFKKAGKQWPSSYVHQDSIMMTGESYFFAEEYPKAQQQYDLVVREYPRTRYQDVIDQRNMEIALYWMRFNEANPQQFYELNLFDKRRPLNDLAGHARRVLNKSRLDNPTGKLADDATMELGVDAFKRGEYKEAAEHFLDLRLTHPDSEHQFQAHFLGLKATLETYVGPDYTSAPLDEAEELIGRMVRLFPKESREQKEYIDRVYAEIQQKRAEKYWSKAQHWLKVKEHASAAIYLKKILDRYPDTPIGKLAMDEMHRISDLAPKEPRHLQWLSKVLPSRDQVAPVLERFERESTGQSTQIANATDGSNAIR